MKFFIWNILNWLFDILEKHLIFLLLREIFSFRLEKQNSINNPEHQNSKWPSINMMIVSFLLNHLRSVERICSDSITTILKSTYKPKVDYFYIKILIYEHILFRYVSVSKSFRMDLNQSWADSSEYFDKIFDRKFIGDFPFFLLPDINEELHNGPPKLFKHKDNMFSSFKMGI